MIFTRHRADPPSEVPLSGTYTRYYKNASPTVSVLNYGFVGNVREMSDVPTPSFERKMADGMIINNPMSRNVHVVQGVSAKEADIYKDPASLPSGEWYRETDSACSLRATRLRSSAPPLLTGGCDVEALEQEAITAAFAGVAEPDLMGLVSIAEARQALETLRNPLKGIIDACQRGKRKYPRKVLEGASDQWLIINFGLVPLFMDIQGAVKALSRAVDKKQRATSRGIATDVVSGSQPHYSYTDARWILKGTLTYTDSVVATAGVLYEHELTLADRLGITPSNIPSALWELKGWSFLYDYVANVGDVIAALSPKARTNRLAAWVKVTRQLDVTATCTEFSLSGAALATGWTITKSPVGGYRTGSYSSKWRRPVDISDIGLVLNPDLSPKRVLNLVALAVQQLRGIRVGSRTPKPKPQR